MLPEAVDSGGVLDGVGLAVVPDVAVLADPLVVARALLAVHHAVLLGEGGPELARPGIEPLLLQDPGQGAVHLRGRANQTGQNGNLDSERMEIIHFYFRESVSNIQIEESNLFKLTDATILAILAECVWRSEELELWT